METVASLIREFPTGSFFLLLALMSTIALCVQHYFNRNRPVSKCDCDCCSDGDYDDGEEVETEVGDDEDENHPHR